MVPDAAELDVVLVLVDDEVDVDVTTVPEAANWLAPNASIIETLSLIHI